MDSYSTKTALIGDMGKNLIALRNSVPIEEFLEKIAANFG